MAGERVEECVGPFQVPQPIRNLARISFPLPSLLSEQFLGAVGRGGPSQHVADTPQRACMDYLLLLLQLICARQR